MMLQPRNQAPDFDDTSDTESRTNPFNDSNSESEAISEKEPGEITMPSRGADVEEYEKLLKAAQMSLMEMKIELKKARKENVVLAENQPRRRLKGVPKEISQHDKEIKDLGRQYAIMICPWVDLSSFGHKTRPVADPLHPDRYKTKLSQHEANIAELFDFVPKNLHSLMEKHSYFGDLFRSHVNAMRSTAAHAIRSQGSVIFDLKGNLIASGVDRTDVPELNALLKVDGEFSQFPRILFPNDSMRKQDVFRTDLLAKILRVLFFGPSSLSPNNVPRPKTNAEIWKISNVTAGCIAFAAILARFIVSPDVEFSPKGASTNIDYLGDFNLYKRMLLFDTPRIKNLFNWYDKKIFSRNIQKPSLVTSANGNDEEDFDEMMRAIIEASDEDENNPPQDMDVDSPTRTDVSPTAAGGGPSSPASSVPPAAPGGPLSSDVPRVEEINPDTPSEEAPTRSKTKSKAARGAPRTRQVSARTGQAAE